MNDNVYDITILGGGPTGLFAAFYAGLRDAKCKIVDSMPILGGRLMAVYPEKYIYDVGGLPKILAKDLIDNLSEQIRPYKTSICLDEHMQSLQSELDSNHQQIWKLVTDKNIHLTKTFIIAAGTGLYTPKKHHAHGADRFEGRGISYAVLNKNDYQGRNVVIFGGGDSALDWANELNHIANKVTLVHRSEKFRAHDASVHKLLQSSVEIILNHEAIEFEGASSLQQIHLQHVETQEKKCIHCDNAIVLFGFSNALGKIQEWGLTLHEGGIQVNSKMQTNLAGVFAAGDIARYEGKLDLIATGFSEAATAIAFAKTHINPKVKAQPLYSTTIMEIKEKKALLSAQIL